MDLELQIIGCACGVCLSATWAIVRPFHNSRPMWKGMPFQRHCSMHCACKSPCARKYAVSARSGCAADLTGRLVADQCEELGVQRQRRLAHALRRPQLGLGAALLQALDNALPCLGRRSQLRAYKKA